MTDITMDLSKLNPKLSAEITRLLENGRAIGAVQQVSDKKAGDDIRMDIRVGIEYLTEALGGYVDPGASHYDPNAAIYFAFSRIDNGFSELKKGFLSGKTDLYLTHKELGPQLHAVSKILDKVSKFYEETYPNTTETCGTELPKDKKARVLGRLWAVAREFSYAFYEFSYAFYAAGTIGRVDPYGISPEAKKDILRGLCDLGLNSAKKALVYANDGAYRAYLRVGEEMPNMDKKEILEMVTDPDHLANLYISGGPNY